jgi:hypothetical protein
MSETKVTFDTKVAILVRADLAIWQKLNVTAFLATGIAAAAPEALGAPYIDAAGRVYGCMLGQPIMVFATDRAGLRAAHQQALARELFVVPYIGAMFATGHDAANRQAFAAEDPNNLDLVGLGLRGSKRAMDKVTKGLSLHP